MELNNFLTLEKIIILENNEKQPALREMVQHLEKINVLNDTDKFYTSIIHRESLGNTGVGNHFAIPHARTDSIDDYIAVFGISNDGIEYKSVDDKPIKYILLSLFPMEKSIKHLYIIGIFSKIFSDEEILTALENSSNKEEMYLLLEKSFKIHSTDLPQLTQTEKNPNKEIIPSINLDLLLRLDRLYKNEEKDKTKNANSLEIDNLKKLIDNKYLTYYERMRKKGRNPFSVLNKNSCSECHMDLAPIYLAGINESEKIPLCNHCGRILIIV